jgi:antitoxin MazE
MKVDLVRIGNSRGVRIPKAIIEQCGFTDRVEMTVEDGRLVITPVENPREGWEEAFRAMAEAGDDAPLMDEDVLDPAVEAEWTW